MYKHRITKLANGLKLITVPMKQIESTTVIVGVAAGSRYETKRINGLSHFLEHMAFKGTKRRPSTADIATEVDAVGGEFNAFTDKEFTGYYIKLAAKHGELAFDILSDMLTSSLFKPEEIEREKGVIIEEINMREDTPMVHIWDVFTELLYGDNPMGWDTAGEKETVKAIKRDDFLEYIGRLYYPENMAISIAGKFDEEEILKMTKKYFGLPRRNGQNHKKQIKPDQPRPRLKLLTKKTEQGHFCLGVPAYSYFHPDRYALGILSTILGGGMSSRLFIQIRERRGLAYYVDCSPDFYADSGYLMGRAGIKLQKIDEAIEVMLAEFYDLVKNKVSLRELKKAKEFNKGRFILGLEDSWQVATRCASQLLLEKKIRTPEQVLALIDKVTPDDIQRVAKDIFKKNKLNLAIIGSYHEEARFKKLLK